MIAIHELIYLPELPAWYAGNDHQWFQVETPACVERLCTLLPLRVLRQREVVTQLFSGWAVVDASPGQGATLQLLGADRHALAQVVLGADASIRQQLRWLPGDLSTDKWLLDSARLEVENVQRLSFSAFLPKRQGQGDKQVRVLIDGRAFGSFEIVRGKVLRQCLELPSLARHVLAFEADQPELNVRDRRPLGFVLSAMKAYETAESA